MEPLLGNDSPVGHHCTAQARPSVLNLGEVLTSPLATSRCCPDLPVPVNFRHCSTGREVQRHNVNCFDPWPLTSLHRTQQGKPLSIGILWRVVVSLRPLASQCVCHDTELCEIF